jgi:hypothetical protein
MGTRFRRRWTLSQVIVLVLGLTVVIYAAYLLLLGPVLNVVLEGGSVPPSTRASTWTGLFPALGGVLIVGGTLLRHRVAVFAGVAITALFAVLFLFGAGGVLIPVAILLVAALPSMSKVQTIRR